MEHNDYPRPDFVRRESWMSLNGTWEFAFDDKDEGLHKGWNRGTTQLDSRIDVPFCYQSEQSGIGDQSFHDILWYRKGFTLPDETEGSKKIIHFGAVDYEAIVWVNGELVANHRGGHTPFSADISMAVKQGLNTLVVRTRDYNDDPSIPRGKQYWKEKPESIFYTGTSGIWQSVWIEWLPETYIESVRFTPDIDRNEIGIEAHICGFCDSLELELRCEIWYKGAAVSCDTFTAAAAVKRSIRLEDFNDHGNGRWWTPERPNLYDITITLLRGGTETDRIESYFGMRKVSIMNGRFCLNNRPYFMKLVLDQGYFPKSLLTPKSSEELRNDVLLVKAMGFNGVRKHQKIEDPRFLYHCDIEGLLVWEEFPSAHQFSHESLERFMSEWIEVIKRDYNHPSIVVWVPINESWGIPNVAVDQNQQEYAHTAYHITKTLDATRCVLSNDGWEHLISDLCTIHDYSSDPEVLEVRYKNAETAISSTPAKPPRFIYVPGYSYRGEPIVLSEFGGISFKMGTQDGWGYSNVKDADEFAERLSNLFAALGRSEVLSGYCYTQFTDVQQEINGLLTIDRKPKLPLETIRALVSGQSA